MINDSDYGNSSETALKKKNKGKESDLSVERLAWEYTSLQVDCSSSANSPPHTALSICGSTSTPRIFVRTTGRLLQVYFIVACDPRMQMKD
jgi:hypothetical protein